MSSSENESDWSDVSVEELENQTVCCLFCCQKDLTAEKCFLHIKNNHCLDIKEVIKRLNLDFYSYIRFINYIRKNQISPINVNNLINDVFAEEKLLQPVIEDDLLLQFDVEQLHDFAQSDSASKLAIVQERADLAEEFLERTIDDLNKCKKEMSMMLLGGAVGNEHENKEDGEAYFNSYAHFGIHEEMLKDTVRTESYQKFILNNHKIFQGAKVLDVGCGTSVLSMFAAKAGASQVIGVDYSEVAYQAMDIVKENGLDGVVKILKGKAEDISIEGKVDVIISEWMGYFLLFESMMDTVLYCRDNYLSSSGCIYPDKCDIQLAALADDNLYQQKIGFWENVYGFKMSAMKSSVLEEPLIDIVDAAKIISESCVLQSFDLMNISVSDLEFDKGFDLRITKNGLCSAIIGFFYIKFERNAEHPVKFGTGPSDAATHWKQTVFFLKKPLAVRNDDVIHGRMICKKNKKDNRALDIAIIIYDENSDQILSRQHYVIS